MKLPTPSAAERACLSAPVSPHNLSSHNLACGLKAARVLGSLSSETQLPATLPTAPLYFCTERPPCSAFFFCACAAALCLVGAPLTLLWPYAPLAPPFMQPSVGAPLALCSFGPPFMQRPCCARCLGLP